MYKGIVTPTMVTYSDTSIELEWSGTFDSFEMQMSKNDTSSFRSMYLHTHAIWLYFTLMAVIYNGTSTVFTANGLEPLTFYRFKLLGLFDGNIITSQISAFSTSGTSPSVNLIIPSPFLHNIYS